MQKTPALTAIPDKDIDTSIYQQYHECQNRPFHVKSQEQNRRQTHHADMPDAVAAFIAKICGGSRATMMSFYLTIYAVLIGKSCSTSKNIILLNPLVASRNYLPVILEVSDQFEIKSLLQQHAAIVKEAFSQGKGLSAHTINASKKDYPYLAAYQFAMQGVHDCRNDEIPSELCLEVAVAEDGKHTVTFSSTVMSLTMLVILQERFTMLAAQCENLRSTVAELHILTNREHKYLMHSANAQTPAAITGSVSSKLHEIVVKHGERNAVWCKGKCLTYAQLEASACRIAATLSSAGVQKGDFVAIFCGLSEQIIACLIAILKLGAVYVPIDPEYPESRIQFMLNDVSPKVLITTKQCGINIPDVQYQDRALYVEEIMLSTAVLFEQPIAQENELPAYIMYTSGTTGTPKGVLISQKGILNLACDLNFMEIKPTDRFLMTGSLSFDITTFEIWSTLCHGACLYIDDKTTFLDPYQMNRYLLMHEISILHLIPQIFNHLFLINPDIFKHLTYFMTGGDTVNSAFLGELKRKYPTVKLVHAYGPTENTTFSSCYAIERPEPVYPIGRAIQGAITIVLNENKEVQPFGVEGDIYVGGHGLSIGYHNAPDLTEQNFIFVPILDQICYKTGDRGACLETGDILFLGRKDHQVKIQGCRIETEEIAQHLRAHPDIKQTFVDVYQDQANESHLCAYIISTAELTRKSIQDFLRTKVPPYMVPDDVLFLDQFPLNPNGKLDRETLREYRYQRHAELPKVNCASKTTGKIIQIFSDVLGVPAAEINADDNFFAYGAHSLKATILLARIYDVFAVPVLMSTLLDAPTPSALAEQIDHYDKTAVQLLEKSTETVSWPATSQQYRLYVLQRLYPHETTYNLFEAYETHETLSLEQTQTAFRQLAQRHSGLDTCFEMRDALYQVSVDSPPLEIAEIMVSEVELSQVIQQLLRPFDLNGSLRLYEVTLLRITGSQKTVLVINMHHIITDGFSCDLLMNELVELYAGRSLLPVKLTCADYSRYQTELKISDTYQKQRDFWHRQMKDYPRLNLPTDYSRPQIIAYAGDRISFSIDHNIMEKIHHIAQQLRCTDFTVFYGLFNVFLWKLSGQTDIIIGTVASERTRPEFIHLVGMLANTICLRTKLNAADSFAEFLTEVRQTVLDAMQNQDYQYEDLVESLVTDRVQNRNPLFDVSIVMEDRIDLPFFSSIPFARKTSKFDLTLFIRQQKKDCIFEFEYNTSLFHANTIMLYKQYLLQVVNEVVQDINRPLVQLCMMPSGQQRWLQEQYNATKENSMGNISVIEAIEENATRHCTQIALSDGACSYNYHELMEISTQVAAYLQNLGIQRQDKVCILMENTPVLFFAVLGVLKARASFVCIDVKHPDARKEFIIKDCNCELLLTDGCSTFISTHAKTVNLREKKMSEYSFFAQPGRPEDAAYILYTSGTSGRPKGCIISNQALLNYAQWAKNLYFKDTYETVAFHSSPAYDMSITAFFATLLHGSQIKVFQNNLDGLKQVFEDKKVSVLKLTPTHMQILADAKGRMEKLHTLIVGGEQLLVSQAKAISSQYPALRIFNEYGPTEATVGCMIHQYSPETDQGYAVPIGIPRQNTELLVIDATGNPCPVNVPGELLIGGIGLSDGYLGNEEANAAAFMMYSPFGQPARRFYRTGDLVVIKPSGLMTFIKRVDGSQIKLRGYRIEMDEIRAVAEKATGVKQSHVSVVKESDLVLHYTGSMSENELRQWLRQFLPVYMIPAYICNLAQFPVTQNGKIDTARLTLPQWQTVPSVTTGTTLEKRLAAVWAGVLGHSNFTVSDPFFAVGGNSLLLLKLHRQLEEDFPFLKITDLFSHPSIIELCDFLFDAEKADKEKMPLILADPNAFDKTLHSSQRIAEINISERVKRVFITQVDAGSSEPLILLLAIFTVALQEINQNEQLTLGLKQTGQQTRFLTVDTSLTNSLAELKAQLRSSVQAPPVFRFPHKESEKEVVPVLAFLSSQTEKEQKKSDIILSFEHSLDNELHLIMRLRHAQIKDQFLYQSTQIAANLLESYEM